LLLAPLRAPAGSGGGLADGSFGIPLLLAPLRAPAGSGGGIFVWLVSRFRSVGVSVVLDGFGGGESARIVALSRLASVAIISRSNAAEPVPRLCAVPRRASASSTLAVRGATVANRSVGTATGSPVAAGGAVRELTSAGAKSAASCSLDFGASATAGSGA
jgi:hypothetical protein